MTKRPNILFIMADQLSAGFLRCYGSGVDSTPALDALARRGMRFERCYAHVPVCAPNRATIFTGRSAEIHGLVTNNLVLPAVHPTFAHVLRRAGYRTGGFGKFHLTPMQQPLPPDFGHLGFDESVPTEDPKLGPWLDWVRREHPEQWETALAVSWPMPYAAAYGPQRENLLPAMQEARRRILDPIRNASHFRLAYPSPLPAELHQTTWITDLALGFMQRRAAAHPDTPFLAFVSYVDPHDPYDPPAPYHAMYNPADMPDAIPAPPAGYESRILESRRLHPVFSPNVRDAATIRATRALYHGSIRFLDDQIARLLRFLDQSGQADNTIVVFTTDHGDMMGDHGFMTKGVMHYDNCIRCPLIVAGPGVRQGSSDVLASSLDLFPSFCDWAGTDNRPPLEGRSLAGVCDDAAPEGVQPMGTDTERACAAATIAGWRSVVTIQAPYYGPEGLVRSIVTDDGWRLTVFDEEGRGQMFNLREDPRETRDLYRDPAFAAKRQELHERHARAYMQAGLTQQYPNLPLQDGRRCLVLKDIGTLTPLCDDSF